VTGKVKNLQMSVGGLVGGFGALTGALTALAAGGALKGVMDTFGQYQADILALDRGLKNLGGTAPASLEPLKKLASDLGEQTLFNEEDFNKGFALLTSFGNIGVQQYERVAMAASDVAQISGTDVRSAMMQLAKALNAPSQGVAALARSGIQFTEAQKDVIKELEATGRIAQAQELIFKELEKQYGGASVAAAQGFAGSLDTMGEKIYDVQKALGPLIEQSLTPLVALLTETADVLANQLLPAIDSLPNPVKTFAGALAGLTLGFIALKAAISGVLAIAGTAAFASLLAAGPWLLLASGITAAAVALGSYRTEAQKLSQSVGAAARGGGAADIAVANRRVLVLEKQISEAEREQERLAGASGRAGRGQQRNIAQRIADLQAQRNQIKRDIAAGERATALPNAVTPITTPTGTTPTGTRSGGGGTNQTAREADRLAQELERSLAAGRQLSTQFTRQIALMNAATDTEKQRLKIQFDYEDRAKQIAELKNKEQQAALTLQNADIKRLELINLQTEAIKRQAEEAEKLFKEELDKTEFKVAGQDTVASGINERIKQLQDDLNPVKLATDSIVRGAESIGSAFGQAFQDVATGAKSAQQALSDAFKSIGEDFISMAAEIITKQLTLILLQTIFNALSGGSTLGTANKNLTGTGALKSPIPGLKVGGYAEGGFVNKPTLAMVSEGGESEYVIPASKMRTAMQRYSSGARGDAVIPGSGSEPAAGGGGAAVAAPIDVRYTVERINSVDYVTADQFQAGLRQAADQGARQGERRALTSLRQNTTTRRKVGI
jgi:hypothetical protein